MSSIYVVRGEVEQGPPLHGPAVVAHPVIAELLRRHERRHAVELRPNPLLVPAGVEVAQPASSGHANLQVGDEQTTVDEAPAHP